MKKDITNSSDIQQLVDTFYKLVIRDDVIGYFFTSIVKLDFDHHLPILYSFWETVLLGEPSYKGNPVAKHVALHQKEPLKEYQFDRWLALWNATVDELFEGPIASQAKTKADTMKQLMLAKIRFMEDPNAIQ
jgi:hemoglobin